MPCTLSKPAGLPVFPPHEDPLGDCLLRRLLADQPHRAGLPWPPGFDGGLAHRLDTPTSGAVLCADDPEELELIRAAFAFGAFRKTYRFVSAGRVPWTSHTCDVPLAHDRRHKRRMLAQRGPNTPHRGRWFPAHTELRHLQDDLWEAVITTGVTHQIRVHAAFVGLPLLGDPLYGRGQAPDAEAFLLHHVGMDDGGRWRTDPVPMPAWARD
jgi:23S rRNA-/tRNA-specific pseudouridylate synthase